MFTIRKESHTLLFELPIYKCSFLFIHPLPTPTSKSGKYLRELSSKNENTSISSCIAYARDSKYSHAFNNPTSRLIIPTDNFSLDWCGWIYCSQYHMCLALSSKLFEIRKSSKQDLRFKLKAMTHFFPALFWCVTMHAEFWVYTSLLSDNPVSVCAICDAPHPHIRST